MRDNFTQARKLTLAHRVGHKCSNPTCERPTDGPHLEPDRSVSIGVAAHIAAAAPGGPRYQPDMSSEQRASIENGIWLCQVCAKLIDSDIDSFPIPVLEDWKRRAEASALREISRPNQPQIATWHATVPVLNNVAYGEARVWLMHEGWQPDLLPKTMQKFAADPGNAGIFTNLGYHELVTASPTGHAFCLFKFKDMYLNVLHVVTAGEEIPEQNARARVRSWWIERPQETAPEAPRQILIESKLAPENLLAHLVPGTSRERVQEILGPPHRLFRLHWYYRFANLLVQIEFLEDGGANSIAVALTIHSPPSGFAVPMLDKPLGLLTMEDGLIEGGELRYRSTARTSEMLCETRVGPTGAWKNYTFGALWPNAPGCLGESKFDWDCKSGTLITSPTDILVNWIGISNSMDEIWFDWALAH